MFFELCVECKLTVKRRKNSYLSLTFRQQQNHHIRRSNRRNMAIAFYTPPEYGPTPAAGHHQHQQQQQHQAEPPPQPQQQEHPQVVDLHLHHFLQHHQDANNNNVLGGGVAAAPAHPADNPVDIVGFLHSFVREVMNVFHWSQQHQQQQHANNQNGDGGNDENEAVVVDQDNHFHLRHPHQSQLAQSRLRNRQQAQQQQHNNNQHHDNQPNSAVPDLVPLAFRSLPDLVSCHAGMSLRYGSGYPSMNGGGDNNNIDQELHHHNHNNPATTTSDNHHQNPHESSSTSSTTDRLPSTGPCPLSPRSNQLPSAGMDFEVSLKLNMTMCVPELVNHEGVVPGADTTITNDEVDDENLTPEERYRLAGRQLRGIADSFRTRNQRYARTNQSTFELNVVISVAVPAVAIIGLGVAYLRRNY